MELKYIRKIAEKLKLAFNQINNIHQLHTEGATIPFIARYRKESTGNLDEVVIGNVIAEIKYFSELEKRKETVIKTIDTLGKLTPELKNRIEAAFDSTELEDIYLPYKPKRKTRAASAIEKGLEPLAKIIFDQQARDPESEAAGFINDHVQNSQEALAGARDIIAEWIAENEQARNKLRQLFTETARLSSKVLNSKKETEEAQKYRDYFDFSEPLSQSPSHRILAIRRGEKEGWLTMDIDIDRQFAIEALKKIVLKNSSGSATQVAAAMEDSFERLLKPSIENEFRLISKNKADEEAIGVFAENLRQLLLASPLGAKNVLALDPGFRTGCKLICLDRQGNFLHNSTIYPHPPQFEKDKSIAELKSLVKRFDIEAIAIGNGTAGRESEQLIRGIDFDRPLSIFMVNESGASIYSASEVAREEFPEQDITVRGAISIGRRLLDPLSELVKIDAKSIGVGQYQHDVNQTKLKDQLDKIVESCVNHVGVDLNTASKHLLIHISGLSTTLAKNIVAYRAENGAFKTRDELKKVSLMGSKSFEQCAGFLRIRNAGNPLDNSGVHPESYAVVESMAKDINCSVRDLIDQPALRKQIDKKKYVSEKAGEFTIEDILKELEKPGRDPRTQIEEFRFDETIKSMEDLKSGMTLPGIVTNITNFGVFVDIGVKQDGLIHISQLSDNFISDPNQVVKLQQKVIVSVTEVDLIRKRISLTMKGNGGGESGKGYVNNSADTRIPVIKKEAVKTEKKQIEKKAEPTNAFEAKLLELKKKFKD